MHIEIFHLLLLLSVTLVGGLFIGTVVVRPLSETAELDEGTEEQGFGESAATPHATETGEFEDLQCSLGIEEDGIVLSGTDELEALLERKDAEIEALRGQVEALLPVSGQLEELREQLRDQASELEALEERHAGLREGYEAAQGEIEEQREAVTRLRGELDAALARESDGESEMSAADEGLQLEIEALRRELEASETSRLESESRCLELSSRLRESHEAYAGVSEETEERTRALEEECRTVRGERDAALARARELELSESEYGEQCRALEARVAELEGLESKWESLRARHAKLRAQWKELPDDVREAAATARELQAEVSELKTSLKAAERSEQKAETALARATERVERVEARCERESQRVAKLREELEKTKEQSGKRRDEARELRSRLREAEQENKRLAKSLDQKRGQLARFAEASESLVEELDEPPAKSSELAQLMKLARDEAPARQRQRKRRSEASR